MRNKPKDKLYCSVDIKKIKEAKPVLNEDIVRWHHLYLTERHEIYKKKEIEKLPAPWTEDEVFLNYRFTNIRRELDKESQWLIKNICTADISLKDKILNCILFRTYNKKSTLELINAPILNVQDLTEEDIQRYKEIFKRKSKEDSSYVFFTSVFNTGGLKKGNAFVKEPFCRKTATLVDSLGNIIHKDAEYVFCRDLANSREDYDILEWEKNIPTRMIRFIKHESDIGIYEDIISCETQEEVFNRLLKVSGLGYFLAYQIFVDLTYIPEFPFSENEFVISGPGCSSGLDMYFKDNDGLSYEEQLFWLRDNLEAVWDKYSLKYYPNELFDHLEEFDRNYNVMMLENSFCELSKLVRAKTNTGRRRNKYSGKKEEIKEIKRKLSDF